MTVSFSFCPKSIISFVLSYGKEGVGSINRLEFHLPLRGALKDVAVTVVVFVVVVDGVLLSKRLP